MKLENKKIAAAERLLYVGRIKDIELVLWTVFETRNIETFK